MKLSFLKSMSRVPNGNLSVATNHQVKTNNFLSVIYLRLSTKYDSTLLMGDFNSTTENKHLEELLNLFKHFERQYQNFTL